MIIPTKISTMCSARIRRDPSPTGWRRESRAIKPLREKNPQRAFFGKREGLPGVWLTDSQGKERLRLYIDASGDPHIELLNKDGKVSYRMPDASRGEISALPTDTWLTASKVLAGRYPSGAAVGLARSHRMIRSQQTRRSRQAIAPSMACALATAQNRLRTRIQECLASRQSARRVLRSSQLPSPLTPTVIRITNTY